MKKLIKTEGTEFEQNLKDLAIIETTDRAGKPVMIDSADLKEAFTNAENGATALIDKNLKAENIKKDVVILGVTGTYEGTQAQG